MRIQLYYLAKWWVPKIPLAVSYRMAKLAADLIWLFLPQVRNNFKHNQRRALGTDATPDDVAQSSRQALRNLALAYVDEFRVPALSKDQIRQSIIIHGLEDLEEAYAQGKGVILISAHYGAIQMVGQLLTVLGYPTTVAVEHIQPEEVFEFMCQLRQAHGLRLIPIDKPLIGLIRTLRKQKGVVVLVVDRDISKTGIRMPFLAEETTVARGAAQLGYLTGAPIVVAYCRRRPDFRYEAFIEPAFYVVRDQVSNRESAIYEGTAHLMARLERFIREEPSQWVMSVPLWEQDHDGLAP